MNEEGKKVALEANLKQLRERLSGARESANRCWHLSNGREEMKKYHVVLTLLQGIENLVE